MPREDSLLSYPYIGIHLVVLAHYKAAYSLWHTPRLVTSAYKGRDIILPCDHILNTTTNTNTSLIEDDDTQLTNKLQGNKSRTQTHRSYKKGTTISKVPKTYDCEVERMYI